jgi:predicted patatin/cPLA2 family phospholipase
MHQVTGLIVQGGAMRAIYSMAVLCVLEKHRITYNHVFGASAGAMNAAYFVAQQSEDGLSAYLNDINVREFINPLRLRRIVNVDYLVDKVFKELKPLHIENITANPTKLHIALTDYETGAPDEITNHDPHINLLEALRASAAAPFFYNRSVAVGGRNYIDGGITRSIPLKHALELGCTEITIILTQPLGQTKNRLPRWFKILFLLGYSPKTRKAILNEPNILQQELALIQKYTGGPVPRIKIIAPSVPSRLVSFTQNLKRDQLTDCIEMAKQDALRVVAGY